MEKRKESKRATKQAKPQPVEVEASEPCVVCRRPTGRGNEHEMCIICEMDDDAQRGLDSWLGG